MTALDALSIRVDPGDAIRDIQRIRGELRELKQEARETQNALGGVGGGVGGVGGPGAGVGGSNSFAIGAAGLGLAVSQGAGPPPIVTPGFPGSGGQVGGGGRSAPVVVGARGGLRGLGFAGSAQALAAGGLAFGGAFAIREAVSAFREFEDAQARIISLSGRTEQQLSSLFGSIQQAALDTRFSVTEANESAEILLRAGLSPDQTASAINPALRFAQAEATSIGVSTDVATTALVVFNQEASDLSDIFNQIAVGASSAKTNVEEIGQALSFAGGTAAAARSDLAETVTLISALAGQGVRGTRAGTALRSFFTTFGDDIRAAGGDATVVLRGLADQGIGINELVNTPGIGRRFATPIAGLINRIGEVEGLEEGIRRAPADDVVGNRFEIQSQTLGAAIDRAGAALENFSNKTLENSLALDILKGAFESAARFFNTAAQGSPASNPQQALDRQGLDQFRVNPVELQNPPETINIDVQRFIRGTANRPDLSTLPPPLLERLLGRQEAGRDIFNPLFSFIGDQARSLDFPGFVGDLSDSLLSGRQAVANGVNAIRPGLASLRQQGVRASRREQLSLDALFRDQSRQDLSRSLSLGVRQASQGGVGGRAIGLVEAFGLDSDVEPGVLAETIDQLERIQDLDRLRGSIDSLSDGFRGFFDVLRSGGSAAEGLNVLVESLINASLNAFVFGQGAFLGPGGPVFGSIFQAAAGSGAGSFGGGGFGGGGGFTDGTGLRVPTSLPSGGFNPAFAPVVVNQNFVNGGREQREAAAARQGVRQARLGSLANLTTRRR